MGSRAFLAIAILVAGSWSLSATAQPAKVHRIGYLTIAAAEKPAVLINELKRLGYVEGRNLRIEWRRAAGDLRQLEKYAKELVDLKPDLIIASATPAVKAAQRATASIPIVFALVVDPVGAGLVTSLRRPGANITGVSLLSAELAGKRLELLQEMAPKLAHVAVLVNPTNDSNPLQLRELQAAARTKGIKLDAFEMRIAAQSKPALEAVIGSKAGALIALDDQVIAGQRCAIAGMARTHRLPTISGVRANADAGFLLAYGPSFPDHFRRVAGYVDKVLGGAKPADLPVEQPAEFDLVLNKATAQALGLTVPHALALRAEVIDSTGEKTCAR
jgi:putative ABC transport system substrate-binding protein